MEIPDYQDIIAAHKRIREYIHRTPVLNSRTLNFMSGADVFFKCENFQKVGAFKFRGAVNSVFSLGPDEASRGVATHSSGNHAQALALAALLRGTRATIVMPETSPSIKKKAVAGYGANIVYCRPTLEARETTLEEVVSDTGATFIHPYDNYNVIAGQGTAARELLEDYLYLDVIITPVGGGGLLSGTSIAARAIKPDIEIIAAEPAGADDAYRSFKSGEWVPSVDPDTICDGLLTSLSGRTFEIIRDKVDDIITVSEDSIKESLRLICERMKIVIEPSAAVGYAAILENKERFAGKKVGVILSGGNIDLHKLSNILS
ncbi:MAG: pyridoxal-phosphate dependent enzyme [Candidatus Kapaibacterium sp.]